MSFNVDEYLRQKQAPQSLFEYQRDGVEFMVDRFNKGKSTLLGDTMGLGKTRQVASVIDILKLRFVLVIIPNSILFQWIEELISTCPTYNLFHCKSQKVRLITADEHNQINFSKEKFDLREVAELDGNNIIICNYHAVVPSPPVKDLNGTKARKRELNSDLERYIPEFTPFNCLEFDLIVADEIHNIRNGVSVGLDRGVSSTKTLSYYRLSRLRLTETGAKIGITGTPIQNKIGDMVSILKFLGAPFGISRRITNALIHDYIKEYMFRRTDKDLHPALKDIIKFPENEYEDTDIVVEYQTPEEKEFYEIVAKMAKDGELKTDVLEKYQIHGEENELVQVNLLTYLSADINMFIRIYNERHQYEQIPEWDGSNSKQDMIANLLLNLASENESVIIFVHFYEEVDAICEAIERLGDTGLGNHLGYNYYTLDGRNDIEDRRVIIENAREDVESGRRCVMFTTIRTSGVGLNLQFMHVGLFSSADWNPANEYQAIMRMHRIGQRERVRIYRFAHSFSIPEERLRDGHIDSYITKVKTLKENKFETYINTLSNAARYWNVRNLDSMPDQPSVIWNDPAPNDALNERIAKLHLGNYIPVVDNDKEVRVNEGLMPIPKSLRRADHLEKQNTIVTHNANNKLGSGQLPERLTREQIRELRVKKLSG